MSKGYRVVIEIYEAVPKSPKVGAYPKMTPEAVAQEMAQRDESAFDMASSIAEYVSGLDFSGQWRVEPITGDK